MSAKAIQKVPSAYIGVDKNRLKVYQNNQIFLKDKQEFQFELNNPTTNVIGAKIWLNGRQSSSNLLVLKPGERVWLDRYLDEDKKYVFETYNVDRTNEALNAIQDNGKVKIEFFQERIRQIIFDSPTYTYYNSPNITWTDSGTNIYGWTNDSITFNTTSGTFNVASNYVNTGVTQNLNKDLLLETGRVEKGEQSGQNLESAFYDFWNFAFHTVEYYLLPESEKHVVTVDEIRKYCTSCGLRVKKSSWKFCPSCGEKL